MYARRMDVSRQNVHQATSLTSTAQADFWSALFTLRKDVNTARMTLVSASAVSRLPTLFKKRPDAFGHWSLITTDFYFGFLRFSRPLKLIKLSLDLREKRKEKSPAPPAVTQTASVSQEYRLISSMCNSLKLIKVWPGHSRRGTSKRK